jgi:hypothetical protein
MLGRPQVEECNQVSQQVLLFNKAHAGPYSITFVNRVGTLQPYQNHVSEPWFLGRSLLHLLVSHITKWGQRVSELPGLERQVTVLPWPIRRQLLQGLQQLVLWTGGSWKALADSRNSNQVTPIGTAMHFCCADALTFLLSELSFVQMLAASKRGEHCPHCTA